MAEGDEGEVVGLEGEVSAWGGGDVTYARSSCCCCDEDGAES